MNRERIAQWVQESSRVAMSPKQSVVAERSTSKNIPKSTAMSEENISSTQLPRDRRPSTKASSPGDAGETTTNSPDTLKQHLDILAVQGQQVWESGLNGLTQQTESTWNSVLNGVSYLLPSSCSTPTLKPARRSSEKKAKAAASFAQHVNSRRSKLQPVLAARDGFSASRSLIAEVKENPISSPDPKGNFTSPRIQ
jgi:hypothetical protein